MTERSGLLVARMDPPAEVEDELNDWLDTELFAAWLRAPGFLGGRRALSRVRPRHLAFFDLESPLVREPAVSPWTARMSKKLRAFDRSVFEQVYPGRELSVIAHPFVVQRTLREPDQDFEQDVRMDRMRRAQSAGALAVAPSHPVHPYIPFDPDLLRAHVDQARAHPGVSARLFASEGASMILYTAADEEAARWCASLSDVGGEVATFGPYSGSPIEDDRYTNLPLSPRDAMDAFYRRGYTDGLPIIPPTPDLVDEMIAAQSRPASTLLGRMPPRLGAATIESLAINAVMAGCHARSFPLVIAAVEALLDPKINLLGVQATTHPCTPFLVVSGPVRHGLRLGLSGNAMGEGNHANATVGRALRLILRNIGGARPGRTDFTTQGSPARYGFVVAENEEESPFPPVHTTLGYQPADSVVTVFASEGPHNINDHSSNDGENLLAMIAGTMATFGTNDLARGGSPVLALGIEHAKMLARDGFTRESIQSWLFERARVRVEDLPPDMRVWLEERHDIDRSIWSPRGIPIAACPEHIFVLVAGGRGRHSSYMPSFAFGRPVSRPVVFDANSVAPPNPPECDC